MIISTDEYEYELKKSPTSQMIEVSSSEEGLETFLNSLELAGSNPYQEFPPETTAEGAVLVYPEVLVLWFGFEILNYGV